MNNGNIYRAVEFTTLLLYFLQENSRYIFCNKKVNIKITENFEYNRRYLGKSDYKKKKSIIWKQQLQYWTMENY